MALNVSHSQDGQGVVIYNGEMILLFSKEVHLVFENNVSNNPAFNGKKKGKLYLTSHRLIFVNPDAKDRLLSFAMPFQCLSGVKLEQPVFGANYLKGTATAQPQGNWEGEIVFKLTFNRGGCIDFGRAMLRANSMATQNFQFSAPPPYMPPNGGYFQAPPAYYTQDPNQPVYGFQPPASQYFDQPAPGGVYMYDAPPPYPGIGANPPPYPTPGAGQTGNYYGATGGSQARNEKEAEAMRSAQQNQQTGPVNGDNFYNGPPPPSYNETMGNGRN